MPYLVRNPRLACGRFHYPGEDPENGPAEPCLRPMNHVGRAADRVSMGRE